MPTDNKPHLVLDWIFDIPNQRLTCNIDDKVEYTAHEGGSKGYTKRYRETKDSPWVESHVSALKWQDTEKTWISENFGEIVGYFQYDPDRTTIHPEQNRIDDCPNGQGPDGRYLDHMQRLQILLEGKDCAHVAFGVSHTLYETPDCGLTIFKRPPVRADITHYESTDPTQWWPDHSQPCMMQPLAKGKQLSSYAEMIEDGITNDLVEKCKKGEWEPPPFPELQKYYIYPSKSA
jgi:hypothetical protein